MTGVAALGREAPLRVAVFAGGGGGNLGAVMRLAAWAPAAVELSVVVSDRPGCEAVRLAREGGIPVIARDFAAECGFRSHCATAAELREYEARARGFHDRIDEELLRLEERTAPIDLVVLSYGRWIHGALLDRFEGRMINQHPGDLTVLDADSKRTLVGNDPVLAALERRLPTVRTTTFFVDGGEDSGPILCQGPPLSTAGAGASRGEADALELELKRESDWPSIVCALVLCAASEVTIDAGRRQPDGTATVAIDGVATGFGGVRLMDGLAPPEPRVEPLFTAAREAVENCAQG